MVPSNDSKTLITRRQLLKAMSASVALPLLAACQPIATPASKTGAAPVQKAAAPPTVAAVSEGPKQGGTLIAAGTGEIKFDPYFNFVPARFVYNQLNDALFGYTDPEQPYKPVPRIAEKWEETEKTLTLKLREGVLFHNGREVVAQDVVDNIARAKDESIGHYLYNVFNDSVETAEAIDKYTVKIDYKKVYPVKLDDLAALYLIPKEAMDEVETHPMGCGPFKFESYTPGDKLELSRFDGYWEEGKPYLDGVTVKIIPDNQARLANLLGGSVDAVDALALSDAARLQEEEQVQVYSTPPGGAWYSNVLNCAKKPYDNKLVRQAMNFSIDREKINKLAYYDLAPVTQCRWLPSSYWYDEEACSMYSFDPEQAKSLLEEAGYPDGFKTTITISESVLPGSKAMAQVWAQDLAKIGVQMEIIEREQGPFYEEYFKGNYEVQGYGLGDGKLDPGTYMVTNSPYRSENNKANIQTQPFFEEYKRLQGEIMNSIDPEVRKPISDQLHRILAEEGWVIITAFWVNFSGLSQRVQGFQPSITSAYRFGDVWLEG